MDLDKTKGDNNPTAVVKHRGKIEVTGSPLDAPTMVVDGLKAVTSNRTGTIKMIFTENLADAEGKPAARYVVNLAMSKDVAAAIVKRLSDALERTDRLVAEEVEGPTA